MLVLGISWLYVPLLDLNVDFKFLAEFFNESFEISLAWEYATTSLETALKPKPKSEL